MNSFEHLHKLIREIRVCMMSTLDSSGKIQTRPMTTISQPEHYPVECLWFFTNKQTSLFKEIEANSTIALAYSSPTKNHFVSVSGRAYPDFNSQTQEELWNPLFQAWFPDGLDDPNLALIRVKVDSAEYWDAPSSKVLNLIGYASAIAKGETYKLGEHEKLNF